MFDNRLNKYYDNTAKVIVESYMIKSTCEGDTCDFKMIEASPIILEISKSYTIGEAAWVKGTSLANIDKILFKSGESKEDVEAIPTSKNDTVVEFNVPNLYSGGHYVYLKQDNLGFSSINNTFTINPTLGSLSPVEGNTEGGIFKISATGMPFGASVWNGEKELTVVSQTVDELEFEALSVEDQT